ncbi:Retrovirus-related Pol polyprotein from type-1 retrotransposable element R1 [Araneus ventricosus]|uniref:Retrovirus-related Pol polyprotein from type-1 retrotransposable element R1 n=1 Tax=Araneus ventricosus TaxID=182803 RepID=A0A4Y2RM63_ARAVE|nr:Retrovirus-related Pol polyprotein from type-1 retrotransposable element R1 [Araneus ventricosus]
MATKIANIKSTLQDQLERSGSPEELDRFVLAVTATIQEVCTTYLQYTELRPKTVPWWDAELEILRKKSCAFKRRFHRTLDLVEKRKGRLLTSFVGLNSSGHSPINNNSWDNSWTKFCEGVSSINEFALPYKICANKVCRPLVLWSIQVDGGPSTSLKESIERIVNVLFPGDDEFLTESPEQKQRRLFVENYRSTTNDERFNLSEVRSALKGSKRRRAPGLDGIQYEILVAINEKSPRLLVSLLNRRLDIRHFPRPWKKAKLVLLNKPGKDTSDPRAYRPICLLSTMSKVLDRLVAQRILHYYHSLNLLNLLKHCFCALKSCETAGFELKTVVLKKVRTNQAVSMVSLDVEGAFDFMGVYFVPSRSSSLSSNIFRMVRSYLRDRWILFETRATRVE